MAYTERQSRSYGGMGEKRDVEVKDRTVRVDEHTQEGKQRGGGGQALINNRYYGNAKRKLVTLYAN